MFRRLSHTPVTLVILIAITIVALFEQRADAFYDLNVLASMGGIVGGLFERGQYWRLLAAMFLHANWVHWFVNAFSLYQIGTLFEEMFGSRRMAVVYLVTGIVASTASALRIPPYGVGVGASGAIFGVLGAFIFSLRRSPRWRNDRRRKILMPQLVFLVFLNIAIGLQIEAIDNAAHIGGLVAGLILGLILPHREPPPPPGGSVIDVAALPADPAERTDVR